jgi:hypothetical protein
MASTMTAKEALDVIIQLNKEGEPFAKITQVLAERGYRSKKDEPIKEQMVRYMFNKSQGKVSPSRQGTGSRRKSSSSTPKIEVSVGPTGQLLQAAKQILAMDDMDPTMRMEFLKTVIRKYENQTGTAAN